MPKIARFLAVGLAGLACTSAVAEVGIEGTRWTNPKDGTVVPAGVGFRWGEFRTRPGGS